MTHPKNNVPYDDTYAATDAILAHTWLHNGGTFNATSGESVGDIDGFAVRDERTDTLTLSIDAPYLRDAVARFVQRVPFVGDHKAYVGTWIEDNVLYVDVVRIYTNKFAAIAEGLELGEQAIYDLGAKKTIYLT